MKYFLGTYSCGYGGCNEEHYIIADNEEQAALFMQEGIYDYAASYEWISQRDWEFDLQSEDIDFDGDDFYESSEYENFMSNVCFDVKELTGDDLDEAKRDCEDMWENAS